MRVFIAGHWLYNWSSCTSVNYKMVCCKLTLLGIKHCYLNTKPLICYRFYKHRADDLRKHLDAVHRNYRPFICRLCDVSFVSECRLKSHKKTWSHKEKFAALSSEIQEEFSDLVSQDVNLDDNQISADTLGGMRKNIHGKIDSGNVLNCPSCNESFTEKLALMEHIEYYHRNTCTECWKTFSSLRNLRKHLKRHGKAEICVLLNIVKILQHVT